MKKQKKKKKNSFLLLLYLEYFWRQFDLFFHTISVSPWALKSFRFFVKFIVKSQSTLKFKMQSLLQGLLKNNNNNASKNKI